MLGGIAGHHWRKLAPVQILALISEYRERPDEQVVVLFQVLAAEINFGYKFQTVRSKSALLSSASVGCMHGFEACMFSVCCSVPWNALHFASSICPAAAAMYYDRRL